MLSAAGRKLAKMGENSLEKELRKIALVYTKSLLFAAGAGEK